MTDTNYIGSIVKILEDPVESTGKKLMSRVRVQFPQTQNSTIVNLVFWGSLAENVALYYKINDYIIIEGYLSICNRKPEITVFKVYPFLLNHVHKSQ